MSSTYASTSCKDLSARIIPNIFDNDVTRETFRKRYAIWLLIGRARLGLKVGGAMTCGCHQD